MKIQAAFPILVLAAAAVAQGDSVTLASGKTDDGVTVQSFTIRELKYVKAGNTTAVSTDQVAKVDLAKFDDVFKRGLADTDPMTLINEVRTQVKAKNTLLAQFGYVEAARRFFAIDKDGAAAEALAEMVKEIPDAGLMPELYRMKFDVYMSRGDANGYREAGSLAQKYGSEAASGAWPQGMAIEADYMAALAEGAAGGDGKAFQAKMRDIAGRAAPVSAVLAARANVQLGHSLRASKDIEGARKLYQDVLGQTEDAAARAGAYLGMGYLAMGAGDAANRDPFRDALLAFLRVRLETKAAPPSLQAEALYNAMIAAERWGGPDFRLVQGRCRNALVNNYPGSEWANRARGK